LSGDFIELDQVGGKAVEVLDGEEGILVPGEDGLLLNQVGGADREDRAGRHLVTESLEVRLAERALPGERLASHLPGPVDLAVFVHPFGHLGQLGRQAGHIIESLHETTVPRKVGEVVPVTLTRRIHYGRGACDGRD
jgi:hypothetical protein